MGRGLTIYTILDVLDGCKARGGYDSPSLCQRNREVISMRIKQLILKRMGHPFRTKRACQADNIRSSSCFRVVYFGKMEGNNHPTLSKEGISMAASQKCPKVFKGRSLTETSNTTQSAPKYLYYPNKGRNHKGWKDTPARRQQTNLLAIRRKADDNRT